MSSLASQYSKTCVNSHSKKDQKLFFMTNYRLMQVKSIAECCKGSILQNFWPSLSCYLSLRSLLCLFLSGRFIQVLLYITCSSDCTASVLHMSITAKLSLIQDGVQVLPVVLVTLQWQAQNYRHGHRPSFTGREHHALHARAVHMVTGWWDARIGSSSLNYLQVVFMHCDQQFTAPQWKACHPGSRRKLPSPACQVKPELCSLPSMGWAVSLHYVHL